MSYLFQRVSRRVSLLLLGIVVFALTLTGCYTKLGTVASSEDTPPKATTVAASPSSDAAARTFSNADTLDAVDAFFQDFDHHSLKYLDPSDRALVKQATRLLKKRADAEISYATYRGRIHDFRLNHPGFYGNFFGDPFYATYDLRYTRLAELRQRINTFVDPRNGIRNTAGFYCNPYSYDPAFKQCRGFSYAASDFFSLPLSFEPTFASARDFSSPASGLLADLEETHRGRTVPHRPTDLAPAEDDPAEGEEEEVDRSTDSRVPRPVPAVTKQLLEIESPETIETL